jgi:hypothetical protein
MYFDITRPTVFGYHLCPACVTHRGSFFHLLFYCSPKKKVWQGVIFKLLWPTTFIAKIKGAFFSLSFSYLWLMPSIVKEIDLNKTLFIPFSQIWLAPICGLYSTK